MCIFMCRKLVHSPQSLLTDINTAQRLLQARSKETHSSFAFTTFIENRFMEPDYKGCPVQYTLQFLGGRWRAGIIWNLREKPLRFGELKQLLPGITDKVLAEELSFFCTKSMVEKTAYTVFPRRTEYSLAAAGKTLLPIIEQIVVWGYDHLQDEKINDAMLMTPAAVVNNITMLAAEPGF